MPSPRVYVETTVPNFYYDFRPSPAVAERREWTRLWWADAADRNELVTSDVVLDELLDGTSERVPFRVGLLRNLEVFPRALEVEEIVRIYLQNKLMPANPTADAEHLALASFHECDFIVTWDCRHLANPNKFAHIRRINTRLGLHVPEVRTPREMLEGNR